MESLGTLRGAELASVMTTFRTGLRAHQDSIDRLNVYPVPDGDTGTNMALTLESVVAELAALGAVDDPAADPSGEVPDLVAVGKAIAHGSLMGARGNSGVILSQLLRGLAGVLSTTPAPGPVELARALRAASDAAEQAVLRPVEGTILTVARAAAEGAEAAAGHGGDLVAVADAARVAAGEALAHTPELLPVLAQAGVVDAGGAGYLLLLDALLAVTDGRPMPQPVNGAASPAPDRLWGLPEGSAPESGAGEDLRYEVMYLLHASDETIPAFKEVWAGLGDSIVVVGGDGLWNCHIHTNDVGQAIEASLDAGRPSNIRVTDLHDQVEEERWVRDQAAVPPPVEPEGPPPRTAVVAVAHGDGVGRIFRSLGVHHLIPGGQSMDPSTAEILKVVEAVESPDVILLPNNANIHPVAMQVCELSKKDVRVVPTGGIIEGFAALLEYDPEVGADDNAEAMAASARRVLPGEVTQAVRDATVAGGEVRAGQWMGLSRDGVEAVADTVSDATCRLLARLLTDRHELVSLIEGEGASAGDTRRITEWLAEHHPSVAVEVLHGGQPLYPYLLSVE